MNADTQPATAALAPIHKSIEVNLPPDEAFRLFAEQIAAWWPLASHSVAGKDAVTVVLEGRAGGRLYERAADGKEHDWGTVEVYEPGTRVMFSWHPGRAAETAQHVDVHFAASKQGTRVALEHRGWDALGASAAETRRGYDGGWDLVNKRYIDFCARNA